MPASNPWLPRVPGILALINRTPGTRAIVLIDGGSGSGKSSLARALHVTWPEAQLVRLDDFYPGWDGLEAGSAAVTSEVLRPTDPGWTRWDWDRGRPAEFHSLNDEAPLIIEGSGALSRANRALATFAVWVELDAATRKRRALQRDGETYVPHWDRWAAQERDFFDRERPDLLADLVINEPTT